MYILAYQELFNVVCLFDKDGKKLYERFLTEIAEKISTIQSVITITIAIDIMQELKFKLCQQDKSLLAKSIEREMLLFPNGIPKGKLNLIASYAGAGKTRHPSFVHIDEEFTPVKNIVRPALPLEISKKFFNKQVSEEIAKRGKSMLDANERLLEAIQKVDLGIPRQVLKQMDNTHYGIAGDRRNHFEKVADSNKHFKDLANRKIRK